MPFIITTVIFVVLVLIISFIQFPISILLIMFLINILVNRPKKKK